MKVSNEVHIYAINGIDKKVSDDTQLYVRNVWNKEKFVEIQIGEGDKVVVHKSELLKAIQNATNNEL